MVVICIKVCVCMVLRCGQCPRDTMCLCLIDDVDQKECIGFRFFLNYILCACVCVSLTT